MANKDGIDLKVFLQPQIENLDKAKNELGELVKKFGDEKITQSFNKIQNKAGGLAQLFSGEFNLTNFKTAGKEIQNIFTEMQKLTLNMGNLDILPGFNELEQKLLKIKQDISQAERLRDKEKEGGKLDKDGNFKFFKTTVEEEYKKKENKFVRHEKTGHGAQGSVIKTAEGLKKYQEALEQLHLTETQDYKDIKAYFDDINIKEAERTDKIKIQNNHIDKQKKLQKDIEKQLEEIANTPIDDTQLNEEQKKIIQEINQLYAKLIRLKDDAAEETKKGAQAEKEASNATEDTSDAFRTQNNELKKQDGLIAKTVKNFASYTLIIGTLKRAIRSSVETIRVLDNALTEQAMVSGRSKKELQGLLKTYQDIGKATGATTKEVAEVSTQYFRQGKTVKEAVVLTEAAVSAAKVGAISTADSVDYLTTAINGFGMAAKDASRVSDRFSALAANSATNYEELAVALSKVASQAHLAEMSMDFTLGLLAKGIETTREAPETIGTALKTVIARIREMTDYGKTLEDGITVNNLEKQLQYVGIALRDSNGELRSSEDLIDDVGRSWDQFNANQQAALAKAFAGTRQQSRFIALMQDYDRTLELVSISQKSAGATMAQMSTYTEGLEFAINKVNVGWESLVTTFVNSEPVIAIVSELGNALDTVNEIFKNAAARYAVIIPLGAALFALSIKTLKNKYDEFMLEKVIDIARSDEKADQVQIATTLANKLGIEKAITAEKIKQAGLVKNENAEGATNAVLSKFTNQNNKMGFFSSIKGIWKNIPKLGKVTMGIAAAGAAIAGIVYAVKRNSPEAQIKKQTEQIQKLNAELYKQEQSISKIKQAKSAYKDLNDQIVQTTEDQEAVNNAMDAAAEYLTDEQKAQYQVLDSLAAKDQFLKDIQAEQETALENTHKELLDTIETSKYRKEILKTAEAQAALRYDTMSHVDESDAEYDTINNIVSRITFGENTSKEEREKIANRLNDSLGQEITLTKDGTPYQRTLEEVLNAKNLSLGEQMGYYQDFINSFSDSPEIQDAIRKQYSLFAGIEQSGLTAADLGVLDEKKISINYLNDLQKRLKEVTKNSSKTVDKDLIIQMIGMDPSKIESFLANTFADLKDSPEWDKTKNVFNAIQDDLMQGPENTTLALTQQAEQIRNKYQSIKETLENWKTLDPTKQNEFRENHAEIMELIGEDTKIEDLSKDQINNIIKTAQKADSELGDLTDKTNKRIAVLTQDISTETDKAEKANLIKEKEMLEDFLTNIEDLSAEEIKTLEKFLDDLDKQDEIRREHIKKTKEAEIEALNQQKEAYQNYFDAIDKAAEDSEYFEEREKITSNISKLSTATDASSLAQKMDLQTKLQKLEEDRIDQLRERSREALIENIDDKVANIEEILEKIETDIGLKEYLQSQKTSDKDIFDRIFADKDSNMIHKIGQANNLIKAIVPDWANIKSTSAEDFITISPDNKSIVINIGGQDPVKIPIEDENAINSLWAAIEPILTSNGIQ